MVSAWASENGVVLGQRKVDEKSNETTTTPTAEQLMVKVCIIIIDTKGYQKKIVEMISRAASVLPSKGIEDASSRYSARWRQSFCILRHSPHLLLLAKLVFFCQDLINFRIYFYYPRFICGHFKLRKLS